MPHHPLLQLDCQASASQEFAPKLQPISICSLPRHLLATLRKKPACAQPSNQSCVNASHWRLLPELYWEGNSRSIHSQFSPRTSKGVQRQRGRGVWCAELTLDAKAPSMMLDVDQAELCLLCVAKGDYAAHAVIILLFSLNTASLKSPQICCICKFIILMAE